MSPGCRDEAEFLQQPEPAAVGWDVAKPGSESRKPVSCVRSVTPLLVPKQCGGGNRFKLGGDKT